MTDRCEVLVVDSGGFLRNAPLRDLGQRVITLREVVAEIKDKATKERLQVLPYDLEFKEPLSEDIKIVTDFSKKTGDYASLSAVDLKVLALTYRLERELVGVKHIKTEPTTKPTVQFYHPKTNNPNSDAKLIGFYRPENESESENESEDDEKEESVVEPIEKEECPIYGDFLYWRDPLPSLPELSLPSADSVNFSALNAYFSSRSYVFGYDMSHCDVVLQDFLSNYEVSKEAYPHLFRWLKHVQAIEATFEPLGVQMKTLMPDLLRLSQNSDQIVAEKVSELSIKNDTNENSLKSQETLDNENGNEVEADSESQEEDDDEDEGWITPSNIKAKTKAMNGALPGGDQFVKVACMTTDFAMQNVLKQMNLHVLSVQGMLIRETKTWILRCYSCFNTTPLMNKRFCPKCGHKTLKRVSVTLNADGTQEIHISTRRQLTGRGKKFSLPKPMGGKHAVNPILTADQHLPQQRMTRAAKQKTNAMDPDYIAGDSPFSLHDVTSRSAIIGVPDKGHMASSMYWNKSNPNAVGKNTGNRRKKRAL
ncbi:RNA-binding protein NOB1-like [Tigriopus californicus]|uniref:RNA-binding protein NOB1-like n=1 Tax=Tigriopus californicus TaxID=6832 RepID=UPI0027DA7974|nr:RNA-binding protein NOB1-like [Tigriopus californicus]